jgi:hypothetical protein
MYYSSLGRVKKDPKFSIGKLKKYHKKYGADYRNYVPASWIPILDKMAADYAAATGGRPYHGAGAQGGSGAQGDAGVTAGPGGSPDVLKLFGPTADFYDKTKRAVYCYSRDCSRLPGAVLKDCIVGKAVPTGGQAFGQNGTYSCAHLDPNGPRSLNGLGAAPVVKPAGKLFTIGLPVLAGLVGSKATSSLLVGAITGVAVYFAIQRNQS